MQLFNQLLGLLQKAIAQLLLSANQPLHRRPPLRILLVEGVHRRTADDQRRPGLVNQDGVHLVHNREIMPALHLLLLAERHAVVAQIVKAEFRVGPVRDIALILLAPHLRRLVMQNHPDGQPQKFVDGAHPLRVARRQIVVHRHHMHPAPGQRIEIHRQRPHQRLAFARGHFGNAPRVQRVTADQLHVKRHHLPADRMFPHNHVLPAQPPARVLHHGKRLRQNLLQPERQRVPVLDQRQLRLPRRRLGPQRVVRQRLQPGLKLIDPRHHRPDLLHVAVVFGTENCFEKIHK